MYEYSWRINYTKTARLPKKSIKGLGCKVFLNVNVKRLEQSECLQYKKLPSFKEDVVLNWPCKMHGLTPRVLFVHLVA